MRFTVLSVKPIRRVIGNQPTTLHPGEVVDLPADAVKGLVQMGYLAPVKPPKVEPPKAVPVKPAPRYAAYKRDDADEVEDRR